MISQDHLLVFSKQHDSRPLLKFKESNLKLGQEYFDIASNLSKPFSKIYQTAQVPSFPLECYYRGTIQNFIEGHNYKTAIPELEYIERKNIVDYVDIAIRYCYLIAIFALIFCKKDSQINNYRFSVYLGFVYISQTLILIIELPHTWRTLIFIDRIARRVRYSNDRNCMVGIVLSENGFYVASILQALWTVFFGV